MAARSKRQRKAARRRLIFLLALLIAALSAVILLGSLQKTITELQLPLRHEDVIRQQAKDKNLDAALIAAVIYSESKFRPRKSRAGAVGLMQLLPATAKYIARKSGGTKFELDDLAEPQINISYGSWYLRYLTQRYDADRVLVLAAYNAGESNVDRWRAEAEGRGEEIVESSQIPFAETRIYVDKVLKARERYRKKYSKELGYE